MNKVSCIIPAYNEGTRIANILQAVHKHPLVDEIIVVDDGSSDNTKDIVSAFEGVNLIVHSKNMGKSMAIYTGINQSKGDILFFLDADLLGLMPQNITALIEPVLFKVADITISMRKNSPWIDRKLGIDFISGERVFSRELIRSQLDQLPKIPRFGLEVFLNRIIIKNRYRLKVIFWKNVSFPLKSQKYGLMSGIIGDIKMIFNILSTISVFEIVYQLVMLRSLMVD